MIKENKEKPREKNGNGGTMKTDVSGPVTPVEAVKEEPATDSCLNGVEEGDKNGLRSATSATQDKPAGSCSGTTVTTDLHLIDPVPETTATLAKPEDPTGADKPVVVKTELNGSNEFTTTAPAPPSTGGSTPTVSDSCDSVLPLGIGLPTAAGPPPNGVQPLPSNVINKQSGSMEAQYMQQQSQIFVFSTSLANKSADAVLLGQFPSIIAYHCAQPGTKKYLEKHPLKMNQFNRQNPAQWLNNLVQMKQKSGPGLKSSNASLTDPWMQNNNNNNNSSSNNNNNNMMMQPCANSGAVKDGPCMMGGSPTTNPMMHHSPGDVSQPSLTGVKVPDENLTPQQRQHREEQLATLRKMHEMLFPEHQSLLSDGTILGQSSENVSMQGLMLMPQKNVGGPNHITPTSVAAQLEWHKLQQQFYEERKKQPGVTGVCSPGGQSRGPRSQGPPPPYHQTTRSASVPTALPSPSPGSPNNPTSNLSLPSPRAASGLNSPSDGNRQQFGGSSRLVGPGPSPTGLHTSLESPNASRPLNPSNPGTPMSTHLSPTSVRKEGSEFSGQQPPVDNMFCRTLQSLAQQKQQQLPSQTSKEPNLMPVPSPQQIQYLNTFEGQELTIQKQPNTSLKETSISSPSLPPPSLDGSMQTSGSDLNARMSGPATPLTPTSIEMNSRFPQGSGELNRFPIPSPHTPGSEGKSQRFPGPSPQSQGPRTPGMETASKGPRSEDTPRFLSSSPLAEGIVTQRFPSLGGATGSSPAVSSQAPGFVQQSQASVGNIKVANHFLDVSPSGSTAPVDVSPTGSSGFTCLRPDNVPLNPNGAGSVACNGKMTHFDPITSMAQMSQQLTSSVVNSPNSQNSVMMGGPSGGAMLPFPTSSLHSMPMAEIGPCQGMQEGQPSSAGGNFVNLQVQGVPPHSYSPNSTAVNTTSCMSQPIVHPNTSSSPKPSNMMMGLGPPRGSSPYSSSPVPQRMMGRPQGPNPYSGANVQVKASAPNTIQYLPAKPQSGTSGPRGPPSLEFLQRFANPLSNLDSKVPTHNLQYFPNNGQPSNLGGMNLPVNRPSGLMNPGPNCGSVGGLNGPIMGPNGPMVGMNIPMSGSMVMGPGGGPGMGMVPLRGGLRPSGIMRMGGGVFGVGPGPGQTCANEQMFGPTPNMPNGGPGSQVFVPGSKSSPMSMGGAPDASQPLPPSMGQSNNFKNSPFIGPSTADPNYAQQFHNFQQQLYATNTRSQMNTQTIGQNQSFFVSK